MAGSSCRRGSAAWRHRHESGGSQCDRWKRWPPTMATAPHTTNCARRSAPRLARTSTRPDGAWSTSSPTFSSNARPGTSPRPGQTEGSTTSSTDAPARLPQPSRSHSTLRSRGRRDQLRRSSRRGCLVPVPGRRRPVAPFHALRRSSMTLVDGRRDGAGLRQASKR
jgi:hypothetical protein